MPAVCREEAPALRVIDETFGHGAACHFAGEA
jgi:hypothetical protein